MVMVSTSVPEVQVMVIGYVPSAVVVGTVNVSTLVELMGLVPNPAVTGVGRPVAAQVTLPVNPFTSVTVSVVVPVAPGATVRAAGEAETVKLGVVVVTVRAMVVVALSVPEFPVMMTVAGPAVAVLLAVSVSTLEVVDEAGLNEAVTPLGSPAAANDTLPANGLTSVTVMVSVPLAP